ncbi:MAG: cation transporter, partial [Candidatus Eisenbacteria bacterium]|nr:cation transporter [Candidatus Eisenbacteria bacterium]
MESASPTTPRPDEARDIRIRNQAALISVAVSILLLGVKFVGYAMTGSTAVLSDALESIINVFAAAGAAAAIRFSAKPADRNHPYGHGKIE